MFCVQLLTRHLVEALRLCCSTYNDRLKFVRAVRIAQEPNCQSALVYLDTRYQLLGDGLVGGTTVVKTRFIKVVDVFAVILAYDGLNLFNIQLKERTFDVHRACLTVDPTGLQSTASHEAVKPAIGEGGG